MKIRVYYEDTDCGGIVYFANYLKFCERARSDLFFQKGLSPHNEEEFFVVKNVEAEYIKPAKFGDLLDIKTKIISKSAASIVLLQEIYKDDKKIFISTVKLVYLKNFKPTRIPKKMFEIFAS